MIQGLSSFGARCVGTYRMTRSSTDAPKKSAPRERLAKTPPRHTHSISP